MVGAELWYLIKRLFTNPASSFRAAIEGWEHPLTYGEMYLLEQMDLLLMHWLGSKHKPLPRPWDAKPKRRPAKRRTAAEAMKILRPHQN